MKKIPKQARSKQMLERILDAAASVLQEEGLDGFGTRQVSDKAGISPGSLYQYFDNKEAIFKALADRFVKEAMETIQRVFPQLLQCSIAEAVRIILQACYELLDENDGRYLTLLQYWHHIDMNQNVRRIENMIFQTVGVYASMNPKLQGINDLPRTLYIGLNSIIFNLIRYSSEPSPFFSREELIEGLVEMIDDHIKMGAKRSKPS